LALESDASHSGGHPSDWLLRWAPLLPPGATVLDLACGAGRHVRWLASHGHHVTAVDRDAQALAGLTGLHPPVEGLVADVESDPWPLPGRQFDAVLVTNYLWRPLLPTLVKAVAPGGLFLYETFAEGQALLGRPRNPDFLLAPGELLDAVAGHLQVLAYEAGRLDDPLREVQRICAWRPTPAAPGRQLHPRPTEPPQAGAERVPRPVV
jgi:SAM-dependent methyltransferase